MFQSRINNSLSEPCPWKHTYCFNVLVQHVRCLQRNGERLGLIRLIMALNAKHCDRLITATGWHYPFGRQSTLS